MKCHFRPIFYKIIFVAILLIHTVFLTYGQTNYGKVKVIVKNTFNELVENADVKILQDEKVTKQGKTNDSGTITFNKIPTGEFSIIISAEGFSEHTVKTLTVKQDKTEEIEVSLELLTVEEKVEVDSSDGVDKDNYGGKKVLTEEDIKKLPDDPVEFERAIRRILGTSITGQKLPITVDDMPLGQLPPKESIQQLRVDRNIFSARNSGVGGQGIQVITKSELKKFSGNFMFNFADSRLNAANPQLFERVPFQSRNYQFYLQGPLIKKSSFMFNFSRNETSGSDVINALTVSRNFQIEEYKATFPVSRASNSGFLLFKYDLNDKNKFNLIYNTSQSGGLNRGGGFSLPERAVQISNQSHFIALSHTYLISDKRFSRTAARFSYAKRSSIATNDSPSISVPEAFFGGGAPDNSLNRDYNLTLYNYNEHTYKEFDFQYGVDFFLEKRDIFSRQNFNGTYIFAGRTAPLLDANNQPLLAANGDFVTGQISAIESYRRNLLFRSLGYANAQIRQLGGIPAQFTISAGNDRVNASRVNYAIYLQSNYKLSETIGIGAGIRYENESKSKAKLNFSPNFSIIWNPKAKKEKNIFYALPKISAGIGVAFSNFGLSPIISEKLQNGDGRRSYFVSDSSVLDVFPAVPSIEQLGEIPSAQSNTFIDPAIKPPLVYTYNLSITKALTKKISLEFSYTHEESLRQSITRNINAPLAGTYNSLFPDSAVYPLGNTGNVYRINSIGKAQSDIFIISPNLPELKIFKKSISYSVNYLFTKSRNNTVSGSGLPFDAFDFSQEYARSSDDGVHSLTGELGYTLPYKITFSLSYAIRSGSRFNIYTGRDLNGDGFFDDRPAFASDPNKPGVISTEYGLLDPNPVIGDRIIPRNLGIGQPSFETDMNLTKSFGFRTDAKTKQPKNALTIAVSVSNLFNRVNLGNPIGDMSSPYFLRFLGIQSSPRSLAFRLGFKF